MAIGISRSSDELWGGTKNSGRTFLPRTANSRQFSVRFLFELIGYVHRVRNHMTPYLSLVLMLNVEI